MKKLIYDYSKLDGRITEIFGTRKAFAESIGRSEKSVSLKMNNKVPWDQDEMILSCRALKIPVDSLGEYFFTLKVQYA